MGAGLAVETLSAPDIAQLPVLLLDLLNDPEFLRC